MTMAKVRKGITFKVTHRFLSGLFGEDVHAKRISSLANATLGVVSSASLAVNTIGQRLALARGRLPKHAIKQVDRMLSNPGIDVDELSKRWVAHAVGSRRTAAEPPRGGGSDDGTGLALRGWSEDSDY